jgi:hypothetical protein
VVNYSRKNHIERQDKPGIEGEGEYTERMNLRLGNKKKAELDRLGDM